MYISGEMTGDPLSEFSNHLAACASCFGDVERQMALDRELKGAVLSEPCNPAKARRRVQDYIAREYWRRWAVLSFSTVASGVLALAMFASSRLVGPLEAAAGDHANEVIRQQPRRWVTASDIAPLVAEANVHAAMPDFSRPGYELLRGKFCKLAGKDWLHLVYRGAYNGPVHEISVYLRRDEGHGQTRALETDGLFVAEVTTDGAEVVVVTDAPDERNALASRIRTGEY
jgi:anti-sigma factor RsiW